MEEEHRRPRKAQNQQLVRYAAIPSKHALMVNEQVKATWKGLGYQGSFYPARVVKVDVKNQTYGLVFTDQTSELLLFILLVKILLDIEGVLEPLFAKWYNI